MKITTKKGDFGMTTLLNGTSDLKDDMRIILNGELDELNVRLGLCSLYSDSRDIYQNIQSLVMRIMGVIATEELKNMGESQHSRQFIQDIRNNLIEMEATIQDICTPLTFQFVLPGDNILDVSLHSARTQTRKCERYFTSYRRIQPSCELLDEIAKYLNRLSDYLFSLILRNQRNSSGD